MQENEKLFFGSTAVITQPLWSDYCAATFF